MKLSSFCHKNRKLMAAQSQVCLIYVIAERSPQCHKGKGCHRTRKLVFHTKRIQMTLQKSHTCHPEQQNLCRNKKMGSSFTVKRKAKIPLSNNIWDSSTSVSFSAEEKMITETQKLLG